MISSTANASEVLNVDLPRLIIEHAAQLFTRRIVSFLKLMMTTSIAHVSDLQNCSRLKSSHILFVVRPQRSLSFILLQGRVGVSCSYELVD